MTNAAGLPDLKGKWKAKVLASDSAIGEVIEVKGSTFLKVGRLLDVDRIVVHGDGILWVDGELRCSDIDIRGKGIVLFSENPLPFSGGWIRMDSGLLLAKGSNQAGVHFRKGGTLSVAAENQGDLVVSAGELRLRVGGDQVGNIDIRGAGGKSKLNLGGDLIGSLMSLQDIDLSLKGDVHSDVNSRANLSIKAREIWGNLSSAGHSVLEIASLGSRLKPVEVNVGSLEAKIAKMGFADVVGNQNVNYRIGGSQEGSLKSEGGNLNVVCGGDLKGDSQAGRDLSLQARSVDGSLLAGGRLQATVKEELKSHWVKSKGDATVSCGDFRGSMLVGGKAEVNGQRALLEPYHGSIEVGSGKLTWKGENQLDSMAKGDLRLVTDSSQGDFKSLANGSIKITKNNSGDFATKGNGTLEVAGVQSGKVASGSYAKVVVGTLSASITVANAADIAITKAIAEAGAESIEVGKGKVVISSANPLSVTSTLAENLELEVGGSQLAPVMAAGSAKVVAKEDLLDVIESKGNLSLKGRSCLAAVTVGGSFKGVVAADWSGDLKVAGAGASSLSVLNVIDSNLLIQGNFALKAKDVDDREGLEEQIRVGGGSIVVGESIEANVLSTSDILIKARIIKVDVFVNDASEVDAIVKGRLKPLAL